MNKVYHLLMALFLMTSFRYREPHYCKISDQIVGSYVKDFAQPRQLMLSGTGGAMVNDIQEIYLSFLSFDRLNVDEAKALYVEMMEELLHRINCHEKIRPHLHNFPFRDNNIKLMVSFVNDEGCAIRDGHVALMSIAKDHIIYFAAYDPDTENFYTLHREPYEEALRIVMGN